MAKRTQTQKPATADQIPGFEEAPAIQEVQIALPLAEVPPDQYCARHVEVQLNDQQARVLKALHRALDARGERLISGRRVQSVADAVRWVFESAVVV